MQIPAGSERLRFLVALPVLTLLLIHAPAPAQVLAGPVTNPANGHDYYLLAPSTWYAAQIQAMPMGGNAAIINDEGEQAWIFSTFAGYGGLSRSLWIGYASIDGSVFGWVNGETSTYSNWASGEPKTPVTNRFVTMQGSAGATPGKWNATDAGNGGAYACAVLEIDVGATEMGGPFASPINGFSYYVLNPAKWSVAQAKARRLGGNLATIRSLDENVWLESVLRSFKITDGAWIGLTDQGTRGTFRWASGEAFTFTKWMSGEPGYDHGFQNCTALRAGLGWMDQPGSRTIPAIVEIVPDPTPILRDDEYLSDNDASFYVASPGVLANDTSPSGRPMTAALISNPQHGLVDLDPSGSFHYVPVSGFVGKDSFTYGARAGTKNGPAATVTVNVRRLIIVDTVNLTITGDGDNNAGALNGAPFRAERLEGAPGVAVFRILGDLHIAADQGLFVVGPYAVRLFAGNNAVIEAGAILDVSARPDGAGPGGGAGGNVAPGGIGGHLGAMASAYPGGTGGSGGSPGTCLISNGTRGKTGDPGHAGDAGGQGVPGQSGSGSAGHDGFMSPGGGAIPGTGGTGGTGGPGGPGGGLGSGGGGGAGGYTTGSTGTGGNSGYDGSPGTPGFSGGRGADGIAGLNTGAGAALSGGSGGSSGGGGGGGGAGGDGGAGGSGGGGGGGGGTSCWSGGHGGEGAPGGRGGYGGQGGIGGVGAAGGNGGGALEIAAFGRLAMSGRVTARGGPGGSVRIGQTTGLTGSEGEPPGLPVTGTLYHDSKGGTGGFGRKGGMGAPGGPGAMGGRGAGGAGGSLKLLAAVVETPGAELDAIGGVGGAPGVNDGGSGRLIVAVDNGHFTGKVTGATLVSFPGVRRPNPFLAGNVETPTILNLPNGAEAYGLLPGITAEYLEGVVSGAPAGARAALARRRTGPIPLGAAIDGYDVLLFVNLGTGTMTGPALGVGRAPQSLLHGGWIRDPVFGGGTPVVIGGLGPHEVYALYVPADAGDFRVSWSENGTVVSGSAHTLPVGATLYLPITSTLTMLDVTRALAIIAGLDTVTPADLNRLNVHGAARIELEDAVGLTRRVAGLEPNP